MFWHSGWIKMIIPKPTVSVIMPVHRNDDFTKLAIESMLNQEFKDLEILLIIPENLKLFSSIEKPSRVRIIKTPNNWNLSQKLNFGIEMAHGKYLARMDSDDISYVDRIAKQVLYMDKHQNIDILGTGIRFIGNLSGSESLENAVALLPGENKELMVRMLNKNPFFHPTVMFRADSLLSYGLKYRKAFNRSQDYDLWTRAAGKLEFANLQEPLVDYRLHSFQSGVLGANDSNYFSNLAKISYCLKCIFSLDYRSLIALKVLPFRMRQFLVSWNHRRKK